MGLSDSALCSLLASPKREMLIVFEKQRIAIVPTSANELSANNVTINSRLACRIILNKNNDGLKVRIPWNVS